MKRDSELDFLYYLSKELADLFRRYCVAQCDLENYLLNAPLLHTVPL
jgi:exonuclease V gamma subunit